MQPKIRHNKTEIAKGVGFIKQQLQNILQRLITAWHRRPTYYSTNFLNNHYPISKASSLLSLVLIITTRKPTLSPNFRKFPATNRSIAILSWFHYSKSDRIAPIVCVPEVGYVLTRTKFWNGVVSNVPTDLIIWQSDIYGSGLTFEQYKQRRGKEMLSKRWKVQYYAKDFGLGTGSE